MSLVNKILPSAEELCASYKWDLSKDDESAFNSSHGHIKVNVIVNKVLEQIKLAFQTKANEPKYSSLSNINLFEAYSRALNTVDLLITVPLAQKASSLERFYLKKVVKIITEKEKAEKENAEKENSNHLNETDLRAAAIYFGTITAQNLASRTPWH